MFFVNRPLTIHLADWRMQLIKKLEMRCLSKELGLLLVGYKETQPKVCTFGPDHSS